MSEWIIGVDPGLTGALSYFHNGELKGVRDMPTMANLYGKGQTIDCIELSKLIAPFSGKATMIIEQVSAMPKQGVSSTFKFGRMSMAPEAIAHCCNIKVFMVTPSVWKRKAKLLRRGKDASLAMAKTMFPNRSEWFKFKKHDGRADAVLIGVFGKIIMEERDGEQS